MCSCITLGRILIVFYKIFRFSIKRLFENVILPLSSYLFIEDIRLRSCCFFQFLFFLIWAHTNITSYYIPHKFDAGAKYFHYILLFFW